MSVSQNNQNLIDLYCNEATSNVVHLDSNTANNYESDKSLNVAWGDSVVDESFLLSLLDSELDQVQEKTESLGKLRIKTWMRNAREEAINWILKVNFPCFPMYIALKSHGFLLIITFIL